MTPCELTKVDFHELGNVLKEFELQILDIMEINSA